MVDTLSSMGVSLAKIAAEGKLDALQGFAAPRSSVAERMAEGKALRQTLPRSAQADYAPREAGFDPLAIIEAQNAARIPWLIPVRMARMLASPFGYMRGSAAVMAADLARSPVSGLEVFACGDMHLLNFGLFASAERNLVFAINDFDEAHPGPWEWDLKRLAASAAIAAAFVGGDRAAAQGAAWAVVEAYCALIDSYARTGFLEIWYELIDEHRIMGAVPPELRRGARQLMDEARAKGHLRAMDRLTEEINGQHRIVEEAPLIVRETQLSDGTPIAEALDGMLQAYVATLPENRRHLLNRYRIIDVARKVVGVGSVGTGCWVVLFEGVDADDPLLLQVKQARESVLAPYVKTKLQVKNQGHRVVLGQRMIQGSPDIFLGWGPAQNKKSVLTDFYVRQLADMKGGVRLTQHDTAALGWLEAYCKLCGRALALAHAKSGDAAKIAGYCGRSDAMADAVSRFALAYLIQTEHDHEALAAAVRSGRVQAASPHEAGLA
jgi:uncharacterized protein (DUF2252 family)